MKTAGVVLTMALALLLPLVASAEDGLFAERPVAVESDVAPELGVVRSRAVAIDLRGLPGADGASALPRSGHALRLNLFDGVTLGARMTRVERLDKGLAWSGRLVDDPMSAVDIVVYDGIMTGSVNGEVGSYRIRWDGVGQVVEEMDYAQFPEEHDCALDVPGHAHEAAAPDPAPTSASDSGATIDVMVVYTPAARSAQGGTSAMQSLINLAVSETNTAYANSGVTQRISLVHTAEVSLTETSGSGGWSTDLSRLTNTDGVIDNVHTLRNTHKADMVVMIGNGYVNWGNCGVAWLMAGNNPGFASSAFSVVDRTCATGYYSFGHEMGHNQGLNHDRAAAGCSSGYCGRGAYSYSFGYRDPGALFRTTMAYNCSPSCTRRPYYSNPSVFYSGRTTGITDSASNSAYNAKSLNNTRVTVANWRVGDVPQVAVTNPNGGDSWPVGSIQPISWTASALDGSATIRLYYTNGGSTTTIATGISRTATSYNWTVPNATGSSWKIKVCSWVSGACEAEDLSDANFSITAAAAGPPVAYDLNGDAKADLLWHHQGVGDLYTWLLNGTVTSGGSYLTPSRYADTKWQIRGISDFNNDGQNDVLWHHQVTGDLYVWTMSGTVAVGGSYLNPSSFSDTKWQIRGMSDFNNDGQKDILWHHQGTGDLYVWYMTGFTVSGGSYLTPSSFSDTKWQIRGIGDFNNDGKNDILWHHQGNGSLYVWFLNGTVTVGGSYLTPSAFSDTQWKIVQVSDFSGDGQIDILWHHQGSGALYVWVLNGTVTASGTYLTPSSFSDTQWKVVPR